tara:strand:- start:666 stop:1070 length:405 start_codon:yes stop_codon:yes gene_type:complete
MNQDNETLAISVVNDTLNDTMNDTNGDYYNLNDNVDNVNKNNNDTDVNVNTEFRCFKILRFTLCSAICLGIGIMCIVVSLDEADTSNGGKVLTGEYLVLFGFGALILLCMAVCCSAVIFGRCCEMCCNLCVACN